VLTASASAAADPRPLPFTYPYATLDEGAAEIEQYADFTPVKAISASRGTPVWYGATQFQTEFEYGITNRLELGLYVTFVPSANERELSSVVHAGIESWMRAESPDPAPASRTFNLGPMVSAGPTMMLHFGKVWWSIGAYVRATDFDRSMQLGEAFGNVWSRSVIGLEL
jgi:hypothetical protein